MPPHPALEATQPPVGRDRLRTDGHIRQPGTTLLDAAHAADLPQLRRYPELVPPVPHPSAAAPDQRADVGRRPRCGRTDQMPQVPVMQSPRHRVEFGYRCRRPAAIGIAKAVDARLIGPGAVPDHDKRRLGREPKLPPVLIRGQVVHRLQVPTNTAVPPAANHAD
ncbi:hypothetical protein Ari01nite_90620 [Paractinoplanes rishiriensis]|uniref:Uncharacterized protein n=1 Tax=Paractinoplanes rishiriensis TaxID=1050105 RepID=A0A919K8Y1_9ACTN|nr:hypothetical protein Ari01nite_90620 [Actinoplanes rishiriensis]